MNARILFIFLFIALLFVSCTEDKETYASLLKTIEKKAEKESKKSIKIFLNKYNWPHVKKDSVLFLTFSKKAKDVFLAGDMTGWKADSLKMKRIGVSNYFYTKQKYPLDARLEYKFVRDSIFYPDSLNEKSEAGPFGSNSVLMMPEYKFPLESLLKRENNVSKIDTVLFNKTEVLLYRHPKAKINSPLLIFLDGKDYLNQAQARIILDNLIADKKIEPVKAVFLNSENRMKDYWFNDLHLKMIFGQIISHLRVINYISAENNVGIIGASLGGLTAFYALKNFRNQLSFVVSQSAALWIDNKRIFTELSAITDYKDPLFFTYGTFEGVEKDHIKLDSLLQKNMFEYNYKKSNEGHNWANWRASLAPALEYVLKGSTE